MNDEKIPRDDAPKFLGVRFDPYLSGKNQTKYIRSACCQRLNIIKTLSHKSWGLSTHTLINIYRSVVLSLIEYTSHTFHTLSNTSQKVIQVVQNTALRIIFKQKREFGNLPLHHLAEMPFLKDRMLELTNNYIECAEVNANPLISDLIDDYLELTSEYILPRPTILCGIPYIENLKNKPTHNFSTN